MASAAVRVAGGSLAMIFSGTSTSPASTRRRYSGSSHNCLPIRCCTNAVTMHDTIAAGMVIFKMSGRVKSLGSNVRYAAIAAETGLAVIPSAEVTVEDANGFSGRIPLR